MVDEDRLFIEDRWYDHSVVQLSELLWSVGVDWPYGPGPDTPPPAEEVLGIDLASGRLDPGKT